jgi:hypothetical protein
VQIEQILKIMTILAKQCWVIIKKFALEWFSISRTIYLKSIVKLDFYQKDIFMYLCTICTLAKCHVYVVLHIILLKFLTLQCLILIPSIISFCCSLFTVVGHLRSIPESFATDCQSFSRYKNVVFFSIISVLLRIL